MKRLGGNGPGFGVDGVGERPGDLPLLEIPVALAREQGGEAVDDVGDLLLLCVEPQFDVAVAFFTAAR